MTGGELERSGESLTISIHSACIGFTTPCTHFFRKGCHTIPFLARRCYGQSIDNERVLVASNIFLCLLLLFFSLSLSFINFSVSFSNVWVAFSNVPKTKQDSSSIYSFWFQLGWEVTNGLTKFMVNLKFASSLLLLFWLHFETIQWIWKFITLFFLCGGDFDFAFRQQQYLGLFRFHQTLLKIFHAYSNMIFFFLSLS